ncbi:RNA polymerase sigma factor [Demequina pelophila]|uniref:RNA polymerase sigma factor n=1 Tax=Demequina pelophila TaxID=1638984 RepID=UPI000785ED1C|nr:sigma-70 family RNA polymerase sigma factor [Demequina pelophila]
MTDTGIIEELYRSALPRLCAYGFVLTGSEADGEEIVQAAIVKTFSRRRRIGDAHDAEGYVRAAMRTLVIDRARSAARWRRALPGQVERGERSLEDDVVGADGIAAHLRALPPRVRVAVTLRYVDDLTVADVAAHMGVTEGAVKKYLFTARELLGPWWAEQHAADADAADPAPPTPAPARAPAHDPESARTPRRMPARVIRGVGREGRTS